MPWVGDNVMYFETGQGSALSAEAHHGVDQLTLEARAYGVARAFDPFLVNSVVGFIGPGVPGRRAADHSGRAWKITSWASCSACRWAATSATPTTPTPTRTRPTTCWCCWPRPVNYVMGVPCADDVMLNYQSTSYHDAAGVRELLGLRPAPEFAAWLEAARDFPRRPVGARDERNGSAC